MFFVVFNLLPAGPVPAAVSGPCSDCHTMHYSQDGGVLAAWGSDGPYSALLTNDCLGCHSGTNDGIDPTPYVHDPNGPTYGPDLDDEGIYSNTGNTLAGGNFYWVLTDDALGHNVDGVSGSDATLLTPPGFDGGRAAGDGTTPGGGNWPSGQQITCAGTYGCHGSHDETNQTKAIRGGHHSSLGTAITSPANDATAYRMLVGIAGYKDGDWEYQPDANNHNQYKGVDNPESSDTTTISYSCAECHGIFHDEVTNGSTSPWLRHPTNYDMGNTATGSEYRSYGGGTNIYQVIAPVGSAVVGSVLSSISFSNDDAIVTCLSCHRAHGTPYYKIMRWDYANSPTGGACSLCHTSKD